MRTHRLHLFTFLTLALTSLSASSVHAEIRAGRVPTSASRSPVDRARAVLLARAAETRSVDLEEAGVERFGDGTLVVRFAQAHKGLKILGRGAAVRMSAGDGVLVATNLETALPSSTTPSISVASAAAAAQRFSPLRVDTSRAQLAIVPNPGGARLAYVVSTPLAAWKASAPRIVVDAIDGGIISRRETVLGLNQASVYRTNPVSSPALEMVELAVPPTAADGSLTSDVLVSKNCVDKKTLKLVSLGGSSSANIHVCDLVSTSLRNGDGDYVSAPSDVAGAVASRSDAFAETSIYFHAAKGYDFFRRLQGDPTAQVVTDPQLRLIANFQMAPGLEAGNLSTAGDPDLPLAHYSNAFFAPGGSGFDQLYDFTAGGLWFGQGSKRDYAYDGDVVYHELTHAVVDKTLRLDAWTLDGFGAIDAPGAMNEGLADYFSSALTGDAEVGEYAGSDWGGTSIRSLDNKDTCPGSLVGESHYDSTFFSGALWTARSSLPVADRTPFDAAIYKAMRTSPGHSDASFEEIAELFLKTLAIDLPSGEAALRAEMGRRGVLPGCERVLPFTGNAVRGTQGGWVAPGRWNFGRIEIAPGIMQFRAAVPAGAARLTMTFRGGRSFGGGGEGTPFTPVVVVKFGKPITWSTGRTTFGHDGVIVEPESTSGGYEATFDVPAGGLEVYAQIANRGDEDGQYDRITFATAETPSSPTPPPKRVPAPEASPTTPEADGGCACRTTPGAGQSNRAALLVAALGALGLWSRRRRGAR